MFQMVLKQVTASFRKWVLVFDGEKLPDKDILYCMLNMDSVIDDTTEIVSVNINVQFYPLNIQLPLPEED